MGVGPLGLGDRVADRVAAVLGSWTFLLGQGLLLAVWVGLNTVAWRLNWDSYPWILLNLMLSLQAAYAGPLILMSQRRLEARDREMARRNYELTRRFEERAAGVLERMELRELAAADGIERLNLLVRQLGMELRPEETDGQP